tara:strand:+ start:111 stop:842 length:732 start_codon:yes stop_codon:yes gene_type:complete
MMKVIGIIPARYSSSRFPGKPLAKIAGKSIIRRVYDQAKKCKALSALYVATDDERIFQHVNEFGGNVIITGKHNSGTERCNEVAKILDNIFDVIINIQGDEPFINPKQITQLANYFNDKNISIVTLARNIKNTEELIDENTVKVVFDKNYFAKNFSRLPIPQPKSFDPEKWFVNDKYYKHIGIYGYRTAILEKICDLKSSKNELAEKLEQLRWLDNSYKIKVGITKHNNISIDVPKDIDKLEL